MSSVMKPVGPEDSGVYWRRRALVGGIALLVIIVLWLLLRPKGGGDEVPVAAPSSSPTAVAPPSAPPSPSMSPSASAAGDLCADTDITVATTTSEPSYAAGVNPEITMTITNAGSLSCRRDVGSDANEILISSGGVQVWSSDDCSPSSAPDVVTLRPGEKATVTREWDRTASDPSCSGAGEEVPTGAYDAVGRNGKVRSPKAAFTLQ
ncbi:MAG: hypothetical protein U0R64_06770 [Candidatus Nanopelagicales bacterium]